MLKILPRPVAISADIEVLREASEPSCSLAIWQRAVPLDAEAVRDSLGANVRARFAVGEIGRDLPDVLATQGGLDRHVASPLVEDVVMLAGVFSATLGIDEIELRLELVLTDSCRKFHADYVRVRLITTYAGSGTQWLAADDVDRIANGAQPETVKALSTGDVGIFRGRIGPGAPAIHRSPPIAGTGERRLLLVLNPIEDEVA